MSAPDVAAEYAAALAAEKLAALTSVRRSWRRMTDDFDASWTSIRRPVLQAVEGAQREFAMRADAYISDVSPLTVPRLRDPEYAPNIAAWVGTAGSGVAVSDLADGAIIHAKTAVGAGATATEALESAGKWLTLAMGTVLSDTARSVEQVGIKARRIGGYVRMLNPPSCGPCIILAGRKYRSSEAFDRHPGCDCAHIPAAENVAGDLLTDPHAYLDDLDEKALAKALGSKANAQAWRDGADVNQLVNAYRKGSVQKAQLWGKARAYTAEGMTRRGSAYKAMKARHLAFNPGQDVKRGRYKANTQVVRLMPSSIYDLAKDADDAKRLLKIYGWIL